MLGAWTSKSIDGFAGGWGFNIDLKETKPSFNQMVNSCGTNVDYEEISGTFNGGIAFFFVWFICNYISVQNSLFATTVDFKDIRKKAVKKRMILFLLEQN